MSATLTPRSPRALRYRRGLGARRPSCLQRSCLQRSWLLLSWLLLSCGLFACEEPDFEALISPMKSGENAAGVSVGGQVSTSGGDGTDGGGGVLLSGGEAGGERDAGTNLSPEAGSSAGSEPSDLPLILGRWESVGDDIAPLLRDPSVGLTRLEAEFFEDLRFVVGVDNQDGFHFELEGRYELRVAPNASLSAEGLLHEITLRQTLPDAAVSEGIWRVDGETLQYEVVQVEPPLPGAQTPPQRASGLGSTNNGALGADNIQRYRRLR